MRIFFKTLSQADRYLAIGTDTLESYFFPDSVLSDNDNEGKALEKRLPTQRIKNALSQGLGYSSYEELKKILRPPHACPAYTPADLFEATKKGFLLAQEIVEHLQLDIRPALPSLTTHTSWAATRQFLEWRQEQIVHRVSGSRDTSESGMNRNMETIFAALWTVWTGAVSVEAVITGKKTVKAYTATVPAYNAYLGNAFSTWGLACEELVLNGVSESAKSVGPEHHLYKFGRYLYGAVVALRSESPNIDQTIKKQAPESFDLAWCEYGLRMISRAITNAVSDVYVLWEKDDALLCHWCLTRFVDSSATTKGELVKAAKKDGWNAENAKYFPAEVTVPAPTSSPLYSCGDCESTFHGHAAQLHVKFPCDFPGIMDRRKEHFLRETRTELVIDESFFSSPVSVG
jgi:hypothetical protein